MEEVIGIPRKSRGKQDLQRQRRNILAKYPNARLVEITHCGATVIGYKEFEKVIKEVKENKKGKKYKLVFDSVSRMSRNAESGSKLYEELFQCGVEIEFLKDPTINTSVYRKSLQSQKIELKATTGDQATDELLNTMIEAFNKFTMRLAKKQIETAFEQAEKELENIHQNTADGLQTAKERGKRVGTPKGTKLTTKKSIKAKAIILEHSKTFGGSLSDTECMKLADVTMKTYYIYKKELKAEHGTRVEDTI